MSNIEVISRLERMLHEALTLIREQEELLNQHGIVTDSGKIEGERQKLYDDMERYC